MKFFTHKKIDVTFTKGKGVFAESGKNTVKLSGLRVSAAVVMSGGAMQGSADLRIWGMTLSKMNDLATLGYRINIGESQLRNNTVLVEAGDEENGMSIVFFGTIYNAWSDFMSAPDIPFHVAAYIAMFDALRPAPPTSYRGLADTALILSGLAQTSGRAFINNGVTSQFENVYLPGTVREQIERVCQHANINYAIDNPQPATLTIWPKGKDRGGSIPLISADTGMVGYPTFSANGIIVTTFFNPSVCFGQNVRIKSDLEPANKEWNVLTLVHTLDTEISHGQWITRFEATDLGTHLLPVAPPR